MKRRVREETEVLEPLIAQPEIENKKMMAWLLTVTILLDLTMLPVRWEFG